MPRGKPTQQAQNAINALLKAGLRRSDFRVTTAIHRGCWGEAKIWISRQIVTGGRVAAKWFYTRRCESPGRHKGTRKVDSSTYPHSINGEYLRLCRECWKEQDALRGIKNRGKRS